MSATINEYIPATSEATQNGNGNGHGKIFSLKPPTDPDTLLILDARRNAMAEPKHRLNNSAKACFVEILDRALHPGFFDLKGVVTISDTVLAGVFSVSNRSIYSWKRMIEAAGYVWTSQKWKSNMWPLTTYHISCLHKKPLNGKTDADGTYGGGKLRPAPLNPGLGCRKPGQPVLPLPGSRTTAPETENAVLQGISAQSGYPLRLSAEENFGSEPKPASGESRRNLRARPEPNCEHLETQKGDPVIQEGEGKPPPKDPWDAEFAKWSFSLTKQFPRELRQTLDDLEGQRTRLKEFGPKQGEIGADMLRHLKLKIAAVKARIIGPA